MSDRSKDTSTALTEVRTVHSRALSAIDRLDGEWGGDLYRDPDFPPYDGYTGPGRNNDAYAQWHSDEWDARIMMADPDHDEMRAALERVAEILAPWAGKRRRR